MTIQDDIALLNSGEPIPVAFVPYTNGEPPYFRAAVPNALADAVLADAVAGGGKPFPPNAALATHEEPPAGHTWVTMATLASGARGLSPEDMWGQTGHYSTERVAQPTQVTADDVNARSPEYIARLEQQAAAAVAARIRKHGQPGTKEDLADLGLEGPPNLPTKADALALMHTAQGVIAAAQVIHDIATDPYSRDDAAYQASGALFRAVKGEIADNRYEVLHELRQALGRAATKESIAAATSTFLENHAAETEKPLTVGDLGYASGVLLGGYLGGPQNGFVPGMSSERMASIGNRLAGKTVAPETGNVRDMVENMKSPDSFEVQKAASVLSNMATEKPPVARC